MTNKIELYHKPVRYWVEVNPETMNPTGEICWSYYADDRPTEGFWILVESMGITNED